MNAQTSRVLRRIYCAMVFVLCAPLHAAGVVVWKEQPYHADASAKALWFERMERTGQVTWFDFAGSRKRFDDHQPFHCLTVDQRPALDVMQKSGLGEVDAQIAKLAAFARQYPAAAPLLQKRVNELDAVRREYGGGTIYHDGKWLPIAEYEQLMAKRAAAASDALQDTAHAAEAEALHAAELRNRWKLGIAVGGLLLLGTGLLWRIRWLKWSALLVLLAGAGWLTWRENGYGWLREMQETAARLVRNPPWR